LNLAASVGPRLAQLNDERRHVIQSG